MKLSTLFNSSGEWARNDGPHHQIVIYAVVGKDGRVSQVSVKRTPDPRVSDPIASVLKKWVFHPAQVNNQPASVKILLGIPLT